jgi:hypothetical protein
MTNNNFSNFLGYFIVNQQPSLETLFLDSGILKYDGTKPSHPDSTAYPLSVYFQILETFGEVPIYIDSIGIFLTLGTDDTPPTRSDLKLGNSVEDFVWLSGSKFAGSNDLLMFNSVVKYKGSSPIIIKEMGLNCLAFGNKFLLARETIEPLVINPDDTYSFVMRIK